MAQSRIETDLFVKGTLTPTGFNPPAASIGNDAIATSAGIAASKVVHQFPIRYSQAAGSDVASATLPLHIAYGGSGSIVSVEAVVTTAATGDSTVTVDLQNGDASTAFASVLSSAITIDSSTAVRTPETGTISSASYADGDVLQLVVTATAGTGTLPQGLVVTVFLYENPS